MIVKPITFPNHQPLNRTLAAQVVQTASRFDARVMIRRHQKGCQCQVDAGAAVAGCGRAE